MAQRRGLELPLTGRGAGFTLLPLADCMLQLLIFFMVASGISMYSLLPLRQGDPPGTGAAMAGAQVGLPRQQASGGRVVWTVDAEAVLANGQRLGLAVLPELAQATAARPGVEVLLVTAPGATVQDLVLVLESLTAAGIGHVAIAAQGG